MEEERTRIEVTGSLDAHALEVLQLEIRRLATQHGVVVSALRIEKTVDEP